MPAWTRARYTWDAGSRDAGRGRDRGGTDATACPLPRPQGTSPPRRGPRCLRRGRGPRASTVRTAHDHSRRRVLPDHQGDPVAPVLAGGSGRGRAGVDRGGRPAGRGGRFHRRTRPDRGLPERQRAPGRSPAPFHRRVHRAGELAAPPAAARPGGRRGRGRPGRLADLAAHRRVGPAPGQARPDRGRPARGHRPGHPGWRRRDQGRRLPGGRRRIRRPDHAVLGRGGRRRLGVRFFRTGRADHRLSAGPRRGPPAQAGARRRPHGRSRADRQAGRGLRRRRRAAAGVRRGRQPGPPATSRSGMAPPGGAPR